MAAGRLPDSRHELPYEGSSCPPPRRPGVGHATTTPLHTRPSAFSDAPPPWVGGTHGKVCADVRARACGCPQVAFALSSPEAVDKTFELRRSEAASEQGKVMDAARYNRLLLKLATGARPRRRPRGWWWWHGGGAPARPPAHLPQTRQSRARAPQAPGGGSGGALCTASRAPPSACATPPRPPPRRASRRSLNPKPLRRCGPLARGVAPHAQSGATPAARHGGARQRDPGGPARPGGGHARAASTDTRCIPAKP